MQKKQKNEKYYKFLKIGADIFIVKGFTEEIDHKGQ